jgi:hypothetical protein
MIIDVRQTEQAPSDVRMLFAKSFLRNLQGALVERFRIRGAYRLAPPPS